MIQKLNQKTIFVAMLVVGAGLATLAYLGFYNRYWADDWCFNTDFKHEGIIRTVGNYFITGEAAHRGYPPNRYAFVTFSGLLYLPGIFGTQILPTLTILLWLFALLWIGRNLENYKSFSVGPAIVLACMLLLFYTLYLSPHRFQILYWRSGVLPYSGAIIFGLYILGLITSQITRGHPSKTITYITAILSFLGGGFSEIGSTFLFSGLTILLLVAWWQKRKPAEWAAKTYSTILTAWIFLLIAFVGLAVSPSNMRYSDLGKEPNTLFFVPFISLRYGFDFILYSLLGLPIPHAVLFTAVAALGMLSYRVNGTHYEIKQSARTIVLTMLVTFPLVAAIQAPTTYLYSAPPDPRGQSLSRFVELAGMAIVAWELGGIVSAKLSSGRMIQLMPGILLLICSIYTARATLNIYHELPGFIDRAQLWDRRDTQIKDSVAQGITQIEIIPIDTKDINTRDIIRSEDFGKWVTEACGVKYYDAEAMRVAP